MADPGKRSRSMMVQSPVYRIEEGRRSRLRGVRDQRWNYDKSIRATGN